MHQSLADWIVTQATRTEAWLHQWLAEIDGAGDVLEAASYSLMAGGKRLRPALVYATAELGGQSIDAILPIGAAVECIHTYSLAHDDLPAMDDDDLRRGKPACHIAFSEATAILAGDALQTLAFEILTQAEMKPLSAENRLALIAILAQASGLRGMVSGQALDMAMNTAVKTLDELEQLHDLKTGALLSAAVAMGAVAGGLCDDERAHLARYSQAIGRAFQVADDCLDVTQSAQVLGKPQHSDRESGKKTFVTLLGLEGAQAEAQRLSQAAIQALEPFGESAKKLRQLAIYTIERQF